MNSQFVSEINNNNYYNDLQSAKPIERLEQKVEDFKKTVDRLIKANEHPTRDQVGCAIFLAVITAVIAGSIFGACYCGTHGMEGPAVFFVLPAVMAAAFGLGSFYAPSDEDDDLSFEDNFPFGRVERYKNKIDALKTEILTDTQELKRTYSDNFALQTKLSAIELLAQNTIAK